MNTLAKSWPEQLFVSDRISEILLSYLALQPALELPSYVGRRSLMSCNHAEILSWAKTVATSFTMVNSSRHDCLGLLSRLKWLKAKAVRMPADPGQLVMKHTPKVGMVIVQVLACFPSSYLRLIVIHA
jgi:hypothetical protein